MTATSTLSRLPLAAGGVVASFLGRIGVWTFHHYMRAPLASTGLLAMATLTAVAGSNALYFQPARHPAPLFSPAPNVPVPVETASVPTQIIAPLPVTSSVERPFVAPVETSSVATPQPQQVAPMAAPVPSEPVGNAEVYALQKKLREMGYFEGTVDGYYGPMTARAIRAFEERNGLEPTGALERGVVDAILKADASGVMPKPTEQVAAAAPQTVAAVRPAANTPAAATDRVVARLPEVSPAEAAFETVTEAAATSIDAIVAAVERETPPPPAVKPVPAMPLLASAAQPMPAPIVQQQQSSRQTPATQQATQPAVLPPATVDRQGDAPAAAHAPGSPANNTRLVTEIQRGLASLGFLAGPIDGQPGEATAKAIRSFEVFHNYEMTGQIRPELPGLLRQAGATI